jgi:hypothetical protein
MPSPPPALALQGAFGGSALEQVLESLPAEEKYNAVLLSLLAKEKDGSQGAAYVLELVSEMSAKQITMSGAAVKALVDAAVGAGGIEVLTDSLAGARENGACRSFATPQLRMSDRPSSNRDFERLAKVPSDQRGVEVGAAAALCLGLGAVLILELAHVLDGDVAAPPLPLVAVLLGGAWGADRYARSGELFGLIGRGSMRLFSRDLIRESAVESASFLLGYLLGLPCCAFAPTAFKPVEMLGRNGRKLGGAPRLVDRILIWLLAPVALEASQYRGELLQADPTLAPQFLGAVRRRQATADVDVDQGGWSASEDEVRVRWAYAEARQLLQRYASVREALQERMAAGVSAGECVLLIEERLKNSWGAV